MLPNPHRVEKRKFYQRLHYDYVLEFQRYHANETLLQRRRVNTALEYPNEIRIKLQ